MAWPPSTPTSRSSRRACTPRWCCTGTACYINGASEILACIRRDLGIRPKETTADGRISLLTARCLGACSLAPAAIVDGEVEGRVKAHDLVARLEAL